MHLQRNGPMHARKKAMGFRAVLFLSTMWGKLANLPKLPLSWPPPSSGHALCRALHNLEQIVWKMVSLLGRAILGGMELLHKLDGTWAGCRIVTQRRQFKIKKPSDMEQCQQL